jgi:NAD(P)-dependent dehydrogenase (short-subunit alcohol dehydrogenase family)
MNNATYDFSGIDVAITGTSMGLGEALARGLLKAGARVFGISRSPSHWAGEINPEMMHRYHHFMGDITQEKDLDNYVKGMHSAGAWVSILINNAGFFRALTSLADLDYQEWRQTLAVNLDAVFLLTQKMLPMLKDAAPSTIITVSSSIVNNPPKGWGAYSVSKAGIEAYSKTLALELEGDKVKVVVVWPRKLATQMRRRARPDEDPNTNYPPDVAVWPILDLLSGKMSVQTGAVVDLSLFYQRE